MDSKKFPDPKATCPLVMPPAHHASSNLLNTTHASHECRNVNDEDYANDMPRRNGGHRSKSKNPGPKIANTSEGAHFLKNVISITHKTH